MLFHERIDDDLFANGMTGDLPDQLARPALGLVDIARIARLLVVFVIFVYLCDNAWSAPGVPGRCKGVKGGERRDTSSWSSLILSVNGPVAPPAGVDIMRLAINLKSPKVVLRS